MAREVRHEHAPIVRERPCDVLLRQIRIVEAVQEHERPGPVRSPELRPVKAYLLDLRERVKRLGPRPILGLPHRPAGNAGPAMKSVVHLDMYCLLHSFGSNDGAVRSSAPRVSGTGSPALQR